MKIAMPGLDGDSLTEDEYAAAKRIFIENMPYVKSRREAMELAGDVMACIGGKDADSMVKTMEWRSDYEREKNGKRVADMSGILSGGANYLDLARRLRVGGDGKAINEAGKLLSLKDGVPAGEGPVGAKKTPEAVQYAADFTNHPGLGGAAVGQNPKEAGQAGVNIALKDGQTIKTDSQAPNSGDFQYEIPAEFKDENGFSLASPKARRNMYKIGDALGVFGIEMGQIAEYNMAVAGMRTGQYAAVGIPVVLELMKVGSRGEEESALHFDNEKIRQLPGEIRALEKKAGDWKDENAAFWQKMKENPDDTATRNPVIEINIYKLKKAAGDMAIDKLREAGIDTSHVRQDGSLEVSSHDYKDKIMGTPLHDAVKNCGGLRDTAAIEEAIAERKTEYELQNKVGSHYKDKMFEHIIDGQNKNTMQRDFARLLVDVFPANPGRGWDVAHSIVQAEIGALEGRIRSGQGEADDERQLGVAKEKLAALGKIEERVKQLPNKEGPVIVE